MKISGYTENADPDLDSYAVIAYQNQNYKVQLDNLLFQAMNQAQVLGAFKDDCLNDQTYHRDYLWNFINSGTITQQASEAGHPGITRINGGAGTRGACLSPLDFSAANSSYFLTGGESAESSFRILVSSTTLSIGFLGSISNPRIGVGFYKSNTDMKLYGTVDRTVDSDYYTLSLNTWYRARVEISVDGSQQFFFLYNENGDLLWSFTTTYSLPASATFPGASFQGDSAGLADLDFISFEISRRLTR